ncbi:MAG TPA: cytochrome c oxidase subunit II [Pseudolabrys sp.]|nr:cytochrome c oxidase subunit II [Pseudolabrys sp.]
MNISAFTTEASSHAATIDRIFYGLSTISIVIVLLVFGLVLGFSFRYYRGSKAKRGRLPHILQNEFEIGWTAATFFLFMFIFWWAASTQLSALTPPDHGLQIHVVAKQWMWKVQQPSGIREINEIHAPTGKPVVLVMTSEDVIHSMFLPALRIKKDVLPGRYTYLWFTADNPGTYMLECTQFCGTSHSRMTGRIVIMKPADYAQWVTAQPQTRGLAQEGEALFRSFGCSGCHARESSVHAPDLHGVFNHMVHLSDGRTIVADEAYIRDSILQPRKDIVAGFQPIMPSFKGIVSEEQLVRLIAYIKSLSVEKEVQQ